MTSLEFNYQVTSLEGKLKAFAVSLTRDEEDAKDLFQETVLRALKYKDKFITPTNLKAWMYTIMKNIFINDYRRSKLVSFVSNDTPGEYLPQVTGRFQTQLVELNTKEIQGAIDRLQEEYRIPFQRHIEGFKYHEISEEMHLPIGTVKSRIFIARKLLGSQLKEFRS